MWALPLPLPPSLLPWFFQPDIHPYPWILNPCNYHNPNPIPITLLNLDLMITLPESFSIGSLSFSPSRSFRFRVCRPSALLIFSCSSLRLAIIFWIWDLDGVLKTHCSRSSACTLGSLYSQAFLIGSNEDEEAAKATRQRMIGNLTKNLTMSPQTKKGPNFVRKPLVPPTAMDDSMSSPKGKSPLNPAIAMPLQHFSPSTRQMPGHQELTHSFQIHPSFSPELFNPRMLAQMHQYAYNIPPPITMNSGMAPRMVRPALQHTQQMIYATFAPLNIEGFNPSLCASEKSSSTILRKMDGMDIESSNGASTSTTDPKRKEDVTEVPNNPPALKKQRKAKAKKQSPLE